MTVYPSLRYRDARAAIDFLQRAFGFEPLHVYDDDKGGVAHAEMRAGKGIVMFGDSTGSDRWGDHIGHGWVYVAVPEVDELFARARDAGAEIVMEPTDQDYGSRDFAARDPEGNLWNFGTYRPAVEG
jgi:uncharacterized glyoxalase superfamily protein PhnB